MDGVQPQGTRAGFVAIVGRPNVGKSTLLNALLGTKVAIVSHRPQTTRNRILGVLTTGAVQLVLLDTPGIHRHRATINRFIVREALQALEGVDCVVLVTEVVREQREGDPGPAELHPDDRYVLQQVRERSEGAPLLLAINKIDLLRDRRLLLPLIDRWRAEGFECIVPLSALTADGLDLLRGETERRMPAGPHLFPEEMVTDRAERWLAAELIREQLFVQCRQEVPYGVAVEVERFEERRHRGDVCIDALVFVERASQKAIVIGKAGARIKQVGTHAREQIGLLLGCEVHLRLQVRVATDWTRSPAQRRRFGYE